MRSQNQSLSLSLIVHTRVQTRLLQQTTNDDDDDGELRMIEIIYRNNYIIITICYNHSHSLA